MLRRLGFQFPVSVSRTQSTDTLQIQSLSIAQKWIPERVLRSTKADQCSIAQRDSTFHKLNLTVNVKKIDSREAMRDKAWGYWKGKENMDVEVMRWRMRLTGRVRHRYRNGTGTTGETHGRFR